MKNKKSVKLMFVLLVGLFTVSVASGCSCTSSMCTSEDEQSIKEKIERNNIEQWRQDAAVSNTINVETSAYNDYAMSKVETIYLNEETYLNSECVKSGTCTPEQLTEIKKAIKAKYNNQWLNELEFGENEKSIETRTSAFKEFVNKKVNDEYEAHPKACLVITDDVDPATGAKLEKKTWGDAWKTGLLEGLIVYPIAWVLSGFTNLLGGGGVAQLFAILFTVIIIRTLMLALNFKGQISTIKMQGIQGEVSKISEKLKDPNLSQQERQALSIKMMDIYKKNDIHPFSSMLSQFISFPIFIAVWAAMNQTLAIRKGSLFGMSFGQTVSEQIFDFNIAAIILFLLMIAGQVVTMKLPTWLKTIKEKKKNPYYKKEVNPTQKQMNYMMIFMIFMVVASGFFLPAALVIYWFFGSVFSVCQTLVFNTEFVTKKLNSLANRKKKAKVIK